VDELRSKVAAITGGGSGIGLGIARGLAEAGCRLSLADIDGEALQRAEEALGADGFEVASIVTDVGKLEDMERFAENTLAEYGSVDIVVNNAGVIAWNTVDTLSIPDWRWVIDVNLWGVIHGVHVFLPILERQGTEGHIVNVSSIGGVLADVPFMATYSATKGAVIGLSLTLASELQMQQRPIGLTILCPSGTREGQAHFAERNRPLSYGPLGRTTEAQAMLDAVAATVAEGQPVATLAQRVIDAIRQNDLWCFPHPESTPMLQPHLDSLAEVLREAAKQSVGD
jgi:NAD(P)-dependent dehydrogenase (short-subunit alcohol dehydrogenase family)